jgi:hypothetical protein
MLNCESYSERLFVALMIFSLEYLNVSLYLLLITHLKLFKTQISFVLQFIQLVFIVTFMTEHGLAQFDLDEVSYPFFFPLFSLVSQQNHTYLILSSRSLSKIQ